MMRCVHRKACVKGTIFGHHKLVECTWSDQMSSREDTAPDHVSVWQIHSRTTSVAGSSLGLPSGSFAAFPTLKVNDKINTTVFCISKTHSTIQHVSSSSKENSDQLFGGTEGKHKLPLFGDGRLQGQSLGDAAGDTITTAMLNDLATHTHFELEEIQLLLALFSMVSDTSNAMHIDSFRKLFPERLSLSEEILKSLFRCFDINMDGTVDFFEFVHRLSVISRGDVSEKIRLAFQICDLDGNGYVEREEMKSISRSFEMTVKEIQRIAHEGSDSEPPGPAKKSKEKRGSVYSTAADEMVDDLFDGNKLPLGGSDHEDDGAGHRAMWSRTKTTTTDLASMVKHVMDGSHLLHRHQGEDGRPREKSITEEEEGSASGSTEASPSKVHASHHRPPARLLRDSLSHDVRHLAEDDEGAGDDLKMKEKEVNKDGTLATPVRNLMRSMNNVDALEESESSEEDEADTRGDSGDEADHDGRGGKRRRFRDGGIKGLLRGKRATKNDSTALAEDVKTENYEMEAAIGQVRRRGSKKPRGTTASLSFNDFHDRGIVDSEFSECFGVFDLIYKQILLPVEEKLFGAGLHVQEFSGWLLKKKTMKYYSVIDPKRYVKRYNKRYFECRAGCLIYKSHPNDPHPTKVINLCDATVQVLDTDGKFVFKTPEVSHTFYIDHSDPDIGANVDTMEKELEEKKNENGVEPQGEKVSSELVGKGLKIHRGLMFSENKIKQSTQLRRHWMNAIRRNAFQSGSYRHKAFAPVRKGVNVKYFVGGREYFDFLLEYLPTAERRVFIVDWSFAPQLYLKRGEDLQDSSRVDKIIEYLAVYKKVKVYVLIWHSSKIAMDLKADWNVDYLESISPNVQVLIHPQLHPLLWSHHQKFVVIDDSLACLGGIDMCFNRYEDARYLITDANHDNFPGRDYGNCCYFGEANGESWDDQVERHTLPRMPWHDVHSCVDGEAALDISNNFVLRWNHAIKTTSAGRHKKYIIPASQKDLTKDVLLQDRRKLWEQSYRSFTELQKKEKERAARAAAAFKRALDVGRKADKVDKGEGGKEKEEEEEVRQRKQESENIDMDLNAESRDRLLDMPPPPPPPSDNSSSKYVFPSAVYKDMEVQLLRSCSWWSIGQLRKEKSIYNAYLDLIMSAQHFIYIENQYFISSTGSHSLIKNKIARAIHQRLRRAILSREAFRVIVVVPVYPAGDLQVASTRYILKHVFETVNRGGSSILELLQEEFPFVNLEEYVSFFCLRNYGYLYPEGCSVVGEGRECIRQAGQETDINYEDGPYKLLQNIGLSSATLDIAYVIPSQSVFQDDLTDTEEEIGVIAEKDGHESMNGSDIRRSIRKRVVEDVADKERYSILPQIWVLGCNGTLHIFDGFTLEPFGEIQLQTMAEEGGAGEEKAGEKSGAESRSAFQEENAEIAEEKGLRQARGEEGAGTEEPNPVPSRASFSKPKPKRVCDPEFILTYRNAVCVLSHGGFIWGYSAVSHQKMLTKQLMAISLHKKDRRTEKEADSEMETDNEENELMIDPSRESVDDDHPPTRIHDLISFYLADGEEPTSASCHDWYITCAKCGPDECGQTSKAEAFFEEEDEEDDEDEDEKETTASSDSDSDSNDMRSVRSSWGGGLQDSQEEDDEGDMVEKRKERKRRTTARRRLDTIRNGGRDDAVYRIRQKHQKKHQRNGGRGVVIVGLSTGCILGLQLQLNERGER